MNSLLQLSFFSSIEDELNELSEEITNAKMVQLMAPADLDGITGGEYYRLVNMLDVTM
jgi:single-stranded DNA-specific DHH superfamily exonuclease